MGRASRDRGDEDGSGLGAQRSTRLRATGGVEGGSGRGGLLWMVVRIIKAIYLRLE